MSLRAITDFMLSLCLWSGYIAYTCRERNSLSRESESLAFSSLSPPPGRHREKGPRCRGREKAPAPGALLSVLLRVEEEKRSQIDRIHLLEARKSSLLRFR